MHLGWTDYGTLPTAMSLLASIMSAATLLGGPVEIYAYGTMYLYWIVAWFIGAYFTANLFIPIFRRIGNISIYAYFEQRFSLSVRIIITSMFVIVNMIFLAIILYGPSLALSQVTGLHIWFAIGSCGIICTLYTSIGGIKAVIWTDVAQTITMFFGVVLSIIFGFINTGGIRKAFEIAINGNRIQFANITFDLSTRYTIWSIIIGGSFYTTAVYSCLQTQAQRFMCVKSTRAAQKVAWMNFIMYSMFILLCACVGCILYAKYNRCDPLRAKLISKPDQLYPLFVIETLGQFPGLTGLFIAGILSASLSTISSGINSIATVILEDIYKRIVIENSISDKKQAIISKILSLIIGILVVFLAFIASYLGDNILVIVLQIAGSFVSPILGVYLLGFFAPRLNSRVTSLTIQQPIHKSGRLPISVNGCLPRINITQSIPIHQSSNNVLLPLYSISVMWYSFNGVFLTVIFGLLGIFIFGSNDPTTVDISLLASWKDIFSGFLSNKKSSILETIDLHEMEKSIIEQEQML
ncbi:unnamed protein product [Rotaria sp. Silwood1]|nr:unnamed protein product [Rotaria sp. Silwood1]